MSLTSSLHGGHINLRTLRQLQRFNGPGRAAADLFSADSARSAFDLLQNGENLLPKGPKLISVGLLAEVERDGRAKLFRRGRPHSHKLVDHALAEKAARGIGIGEGRLYLVLAQVQEQAPCGFKADSLRGGRLWFGS